MSPFSPEEEIKTSAIGGFIPSITSSEKESSLSQRGSEVASG